MNYAVWSGVGMTGLGVICALLPRLIYGLTSAAVPAAVWRAFARRRWQDAPCAQYVRPPTSRKDRGRHWHGADSLRSDPAPKSGASGVRSLCGSRRRWCGSKAACSFCRRHSGREHRRHCARPGDGSVSGQVICIRDSSQLRSRLTRSLYTFELSTPYSDSRR